MVASRQPVTEIPLKQWIVDEAQRLGATVGSIEYRLRAGKYAALPLRRVNKRVVFVRIDNAERRIP